MGFWGLFNSLQQAFSIHGVLLYFPNKVSFSLTIVLIISCVPNENANIFPKYMPKYFHWSGPPDIKYFRNAWCAAASTLRNGALPLRMPVGFKGGKKWIHEVFTSIMGGTMFCTVSKYRRFSFSKICTPSYFKIVPNIVFNCFSMSAGNALHGKVRLSPAIFRIMQAM